MDNIKIRKTSWYLMAAAGCLQVVQFFFPGYAHSLLMLSLLLLGSGIYAHFVSKGRRPFKQWELYIFPAIVYLIPLLSFPVTLFAMRQVSEVPRADDGEAPAAATKSKGRLIAPVVGGIAGFVVGLFVMAKQGEGLGDSPGVGLSLMFMAGNAGLIGAIAGSAIRIARDLRAGKDGSRAQTIITAVLLVLFGTLWFFQWQGVEDFRGRMHDRQAVTELKDVRVSLEEFLALKDRYPGDFSELTGVIGRAVPSGMRFEYSRIPGKVDGYVIRAFHENGHMVYQAKSDNSDLLVRYKTEGDDKFRPLL